MKDGNRIEVMRMTSEAAAQLAEIARRQPEPWRKPDTDFGSLLADRGVTEYAKPSGITADQESLRLQPGASRTPNHWDQQGLTYHSAFDKLTPARATDPLIWTWLTHFVHHEYNIARWPMRRNSNPANHVAKHWFFSHNQTENIHKWNGPSRTWWLANTALQAASSARGAFTAAQACEQYARRAVQYHIISSYSLARNSDVLAAITDALINDAKGINAERGTHAIMRALNLAAGTLCLDAMPQEDLKELITDIVDKTMRQHANVRSSHHLRGVAPLRTLSLGGGVQSTVLALLIEQGFFGDEAPEYAIFADTGWEPQSVYDHLDWLESQLQQLKLVRVRAEYRGEPQNIQTNILAGRTTQGRKYLGIPAHLSHPDGKRAGMAARQCTKDYKITPINHWLKAHLGIRRDNSPYKGRMAEIWLGISADEPARIKPSREPWAAHHYPLVELGWGRAQCQNWFNEHYPGRYLPRSACIGCPYKNNAEWKWLRDHSPKEFEEAVLVDRALRETPIVRDAITSNGQLAYLHRKGVPLEEADLSDTKDYDQIMADECDGVCAI